MLLQLHQQRHYNGAQDFGILVFDYKSDYEIFHPNRSKFKSLFGLVSENIIVIKLSGYDSQWQSLVVSLLLEQFYSQMHLSGKPKGDYRGLTNLVLVDEAVSLVWGLC